MELHVIIPDFEVMFSQIMDFQTEETSPFWSKPLFHFYPQLDEPYALSLSFADRKRYFEQTLQNVYKELRPTFQQKANLYQAYWETCKPQITAALSEAFGVDCGELLNDMNCQVSMNPVSPRYLKERTFTIFYLNSEKGMMGLSIHEIIHFVWFLVWNRLFEDSYEEYETPSLKWILSEMVVESIMKDERLSSINPYFPRENGGCIYPYFYDLVVEEKPILDTLDELYRSRNIQDFMKESYAYCLAHETEIREHIRRSEDNF